MAQGFKRLGIPIAALLAAALIGLGALSWLLDGAAAQRAVEDQIRAATGLDIAVNGGIEVAAFPAPRITLHQVGLKEGGAEALTVDALTANLRLVPLLSRRFEIADVTLLRPHLNVARDADGRSNWKAIAEKVTRSMAPGNDHPLSFSEIRITDGMLSYVNDAGRVNETVDDIDLSLAWPSISRSFAATGEFTWRGERVDGSLSIGDLAAALSGDRSMLKARLASTPLKLAFDGAFANRSSLLLEGTLAADGPSLRNALRWAGQPVPDTGGFGRFSLKARTNAVGESVALTNVNTELDGNAAEGVITFTRNERPALQATLAADALDVTPYVETVRLLAGGARDWNRQPFDLAGLSATDLDIRLSAARLTIGSTRLGRTAIGANLRNGTLALSVGEAQIYGGIAKGSLSVARTDGNADVKTQFELTDVDFAAGAGELFGLSRLSGRGNIALALEASGSNLYALAQSLDGTATLTGHDGAIGGLNVEQLLRRLERRPLSGTGNFRSGSTPFDTLTIALRIDDGVATTEDVHVEGPTVRLAVTGTVSVPAREYDLKGVASLVSAGDAATAFELPFVVQGPWDDPLVFPDPDSLIRRSPASAPLLNSLKDRKTRDAVKSVIERFTGPRKTAPAEPQPAAVPPPGDRANGPTASAPSGKAD